MIDLHSHILPGIDDGPRSLDSSIQLLRELEVQGVKVVLATPHIHHGTFDNDIAIIQKSFELVKAGIIESNIDLHLGYAAEVRICPEILIMAKAEQLPFVGEFNSKKVLLLEFPHSHVPPGSEKLIDWLLSHDILPMIAHPERNRDAWSIAEVMTPFKQRHCLFQITAGSLIGEFGSRAEKLAWEYVSSYKNVIVASDCHNLSKRSPRMSEAFSLINGKLGIERANFLFNTLPSELIASNKTFS